MQTSCDGESERLIWASSTMPSGHNLAGAVDVRNMDYRILGSFEVRAGDRLVGLGGEKPHALLAVLLLHRN